MVLVLTQLVESSASLDHGGMVRTQAEDTQCYIIERSAKDGRDALNVDTPAAILRVCTIQQVANEL